LSWIFFKKTTNSLSSFSSIINQRLNNGEGMQDFIVRIILVDGAMGERG
jgi:hypothetical protein